MRIKVSLMYPKSHGAMFDMDYYCDTHMAVVRRLLVDVLKGRLLARAGNRESWSRHTDESRDCLQERCRQKWLLQNSHTIRR